MGLLSWLFGKSEPQQPAAREYALSMLEIKYLWDYPESMREEYHQHIQTCLTTHPEQRWAEWSAQHPSPFVYYSIAGINYRKGIRQFLGNIDCLLVAEPDNPHDPNAIRIEEYHTHHHLGYIPAKSTDELRTLITLPHHCTATIDQCTDHDQPCTFFTGRICIDKKKRCNTQQKCVTSNQINKSK